MPCVTRAVKLAKPPGRLTELFGRNVGRFASEWLTLTFARQAAESVKTKTDAFRTSRCATSLEKSY